MTSYDSSVNSLYLAYYGRPADPAGLQFWSQQLANANGNVSAIVDAFATSHEAQVRFGADSAADQISAIYQQLFNRAPDQAGLAYWTKAVQSGSTSIGQVAIDILHGAQHADADLTSLRQQAVQAFTAQVASSGSAYDGFAAVEAARLLVQAVTLNTSASDMASLVKSVATLTDVASGTPSVIDAISVGSTLSDLLTTQRGAAEPVELVHTLADVATAAAGDPAALESLLRGGGMAQVLKVMPTEATLHDVAVAFVDGGLPAAVQVVYPPAPEPTPAPVPAPVPVVVAGPAVIGLDVSPNDGHLAVGESATLQVKFDQAVNVQDHTSIALNDGGSAVYTSGSGTDTLSFTYTVAAGEHTAQLATAASHALNGGISGAAGSVAADAFDGKAPNMIIAVDGDAPVQTLAFHTISQSDGVSADVAGTGLPLMTNEQIVSVRATLSSALAADEHVEYSVDNGHTWSQDGVSVDGTLVRIGRLDSANPTLELRVADDAGNAGTATSHAIVFDNVGPNVGFVSFGGVTQGERDMVHDNVTNVSHANVTFAYAGDNLAPGESFQYSTDGVNWNSQNITVDTTAHTMTITGIDLTQGAPALDGTIDTTVSMRLADQAGNTTMPVGQTIVYDTHADAPTLTLALDSGALNNDGITSLGEVDVHGLESGGAWHYSTDGGQSWIDGEQATDGTAALILSGNGDHTVLVQQIDAAGNLSDISAPLHFTLDTTAPTGATPAFDHVEQASPNDAHQSTLPNPHVYFNYTGTLDSDAIVQWHASGAPPDAWNTVDPASIGQDHVIDIGQVDVSGGDVGITLRVIDTAGNVGRAIQADVAMAPAAPALQAAGWSNMDGIAVQSNQEAPMYLVQGNNVTPIFSTTGGDAIDGVVTVGDQGVPVSGQLGVGTPANIVSPAVFSLGTAGNDMLTGDNVWGYGGDDVITGTSQTSNNLFGGAGADTIDGGGGDDYVYVQTGESSVTSTSGVAAGFDTIIMGSNNSYTVATNATVANVMSMASLANPADASGSALLAALNGAYAMAVDMSGNRVALLAGFQNGDTYLAVDNDYNGSIDANDTVIKIVGQCDITQGNGSQIVLHHVDTGPIVT